MDPKATRLQVCYGKKDPLVSSTVLKLLMYSHPYLYHLSILVGLGLNGKEAIDTPLGG
jgi:hypothetical protein